MKQRLFGRICKGVCLFVLTAASTATLAACHTVQGAGKDIQAAGKAIDRAADDSN